MKKRFKDKIWLVSAAVGLALIMAIVLIVGLVLETKKIREFKVDVFVLCYESDICIAEGPDGTVKMNNENLPAIYNLVQKARGKVTRGEPEAIDSVVYKFDCHDEDWTMTVDKISDERIRITLEGPRNYTMYMSNRKTFESFQKAASEKGYTAKNKVIPGSN